MKYWSIWVSALLLGGCAHLQDQHSFKKGETLERLAHRYQIGRKALAALNGWEDLEPFLPDKTQINLTPSRGALRERWADDYVQPAVYAPTTARFVWPLKGRLSSHFGYRWGSHHQGIDISAPPGQPIKAVRDGKVIYSGKVSGYGNLIILYHGRGISTVYAHALKRLVRKGRHVKRGQPIGLVGSTGRSTGPHLHFEVRKYKEAVDPLRYLR